jgi:hypothetical protein
VQLIEGAAYRRPATLPNAYTYKFVADFTALIGTATVSFRGGQVISRDSHTPDMIAQLFQRGAMLEALWDGTLIG